MAQKSQAGVRAEIIRESREVHRRGHIVAKARPAWGKGIAVLYKGRVYNFFDQTHMFPTFDVPAHEFMHWMEVGHLAYDWSPHGKEKVQAAVLKKNPIPRSWTPARVRRLKNGQVQVAVTGRGRR